MATAAELEAHQVAKCRSKVPYRSRKLALTRMNNLRAHAEFEPGAKRPCAVYKCRVCRQWHMTSRPHVDG